MSKGYLSLLCLALIFFMSSHLFAQSLYPDWRISVVNTSRMEYHKVTGDKESSPYQYRSYQPYDEFNMNFSYRRNPYDTIRGQFFGVLSDSMYRTGEDDGFVPERMNLFWEKGDIPVPFRLEVGDYYAFFSYRTLQRSLKGVQLEIQPYFGGGLKHSILMLAGANQPSWRHFDVDENFTAGFSYLIEDSHKGKYCFNFIHNSRQADRNTGALSRRQQVYSLAFERPFSFLLQNIIVESELSLFSGDHDGITDPQSGQDRQDWGFYFQARGRQRNLPLSYRFRFEAYADDFRPEGAVITPNRRIIEGHLGWLFPNGLELRGRAQIYRDNWQSSNPQDTEVFGITASGPLLFGLIKGLTGNLDVFVENIDDEDGTVDQTTLSTSLNLSFPIKRQVNGRIALSYIDTDDEFVSSTITKQTTFALDLTPKLFGINTTISPSFTIRHMHAPDTRQTDTAFNLSLNLRKRAHILNMNISFNHQLMSPGADVDTATYSLSYRYITGKNEFGLELGGINREPKPGRSTGSYRAFLFWTYRFDISKKMKKKVNRAELVEQQGARRRFDPSILGRLVPGLKIKEAIKILARFGIKSPTPQGNLLIYEIRLFDEIEQRQRLVLVTENGRLKKTAFLIEYERVGRPYDFMQTFEWVKELLITYFGMPTRFYEKGKISADLFEDINRDAFIRIYEWVTPYGILRLGIPRRLDKKIEIEIQYAKGFPPVNYTLWGMEQVK